MAHFLYLQEAFKKYWNGELLDSIPQILGLARTMTWNGRSPVVNSITKLHSPRIADMSDVCVKVKTISKSDGVYIIDKTKCEDCRACVNMYV